jgi:kynurenine formamidase
MLRRIALGSMCSALLACATPTLSTGLLVDLTHAFDADTVYWPTEEEGFALERGPSGLAPEGYYYEAHRFRGAEHGGTHLDAPIHFRQGGQSVEQIPLERLVGPAVVVDVTLACARDRDYRVDVGDLQGWEARHGEIPRGAIVLLRTGFGRFWPDRERYMGTAARGAEAAAQLHFPGLHPEAAHWLATQREIRAVGIDTPSIDHGPSREFLSHRALFESSIPVFENVAQLDALPARDFSVVALPMLIRGGSGGPLRIIAILPE